MAMANSIEGRFPFLDHELIEFASRIPARRKMPGLDEKRVLKDLGKNILPAGVLRRKKFPYRAPDFMGFLNWTRGKEFLEERLAPDAVADVGLFDPGKVTRLFQKALGLRQSSLTSSDNLVLMAVLSTQIFMRRFFGTWESMKSRKFMPTDYVREIPTEERRCP